MMEEIVKKFTKIKETIMALNTSDWEVLGLASISCMLVNFGFGGTLGGIASGVVIGLLLLKKI